MKLRYTLTFLIMISAITGCEEGKSLQELEAESKRETKAVTVMVGKGEISSSLVALGDIPYTAAEETRVSSPVSGMIEKIFVGENDIVKEGDQIAQIDGTIIKSPATGTVIYNFFYEGQKAFPNMVIVTIIDLRHILAVVEINEIDIEKIRRGQIVEVTAYPYPERKFRGRVIGVSPSINPVTRKALVKIEVSNEDSLLKLGMFVKARIINEQHEGILVIPEKAILHSEDKEVVFIKSDKGYQLREVETGLRDDGKVEIIRGLKEGEEIVIEGNFELLHRDFKKIAEEEEEEEIYD